MAEKKLIMEKGFVLGREIKEATEEFVSRDGKIVPAQPKRFVVHVITSSMVDKLDGMSYMTKMSFTVDEDLYKKCTYKIDVEAVFEYVVTQTGGVPKPIKLMPVTNRN